MKKKLGIVTYSENAGLGYKKELSKVFDDEVEIINYSFELNNIKNIGKLDVLLVSTYSQYEIIKKQIDKDVNIVIIKLTLSKKGYEKMKELSNIKTAMLVNLSLEMAIETIALLNQLGFGNTEFIPVYPNSKEIKGVDVAITTGEMGYVPKDVAQVYDIGDRVIDKNTIVETAVNLNNEHILKTEKVRKYFDSLVSYDLGIDFLLNRSNILRNQFDTLLNIIEKGIIGVDYNGIIQSCNGNAKKIINFRDKKLLGENSKLIMPQIDFESVIKTGLPINNKLVILNDKRISLSIYPIFEEHEKCSGAYAVIENFDVKENIQNKLRLQLEKKGHIAKYNIDDIIGDSPQITQVKNLIRRMAPSKSTVLITGESGTGKELVAQAIHNLSSNKNRHFVAINCAAFNANLLESELFGYVEGAFTGASKGGKIGIFEMANNGTLFLDEIGEIPIELQSRLLRVIQEREVMRIGGDEIIKINIRLITATNKDLKEQVEKGLFRKDLYYRLNVLPINVPPLSERKEDIPLLLNTFKVKNNSSFAFNDKTINFLKNYIWDGNIRELINCMEYLDNLNKDVIDVEDLPYCMINKKDTIKDTRNDNSNVNLNAKDNTEFVLRVLYNAFKNKKRVGRRTISKIAFKENIYLSENDIRKIQNNLESLGFINISIGRGGSTISKKGIEYIEKSI